METGLHPIDLTIVIMYMVGVFILGSFFGKYVKNAGDFFVASRALPFWAIGMSIVVSDIGAMDFVAVAGGAYTDGIAVANFDWMGSMPAMVFAAFVFVPYFWRSGVYTIPEWLGRRYNTAVQIIHGGIWGVFMLTMLSLMLWVTGDQLSNTILGWDPRRVIWLMVFITGVYTFSGGLSAVVMVDVVQLIIMFVGGIALLVLSMWEVGGPAGLQEKVANLPPRAIGWPPRWWATGPGRQASAAPRSDASTRCPRPVRSRATSASKMPMAAHNAPARSATSAPGTTGDPSRGPVKSKRPARPM